MSHIVLPEQLHLRAINERWRLEYQRIEASSRVILQWVNRQLIFQGKIQTFQCCVPMLRQWLIAKAKRHLSPWLHQLSEEMDLPFAGVSYRLPRTRWGSCSSEKRITLNGFLLMLPRHLVEYVLIHELCHTVYLDHSADYWRLVGQFLPHYKALKQELRCADRWLELK